MKLVIDNKSYPSKIHDNVDLGGVKTQIVICNSFRSELNHIIRLNNLLNSVKWPHYTIDRCGEIYEHVNPLKPSYYLSGVSDEYQKNIVITLSNMGRLNSINNVIYENFLFEKCDVKNVGSLVDNRKILYWEKYPQKQIKVLNGLLDFLVEKYEIHNQLIDFISYHKDIAKYRGIVYESNYYKSELYQNPLLILHTSLVENRNKITIKKEA